MAERGENDLNRAVLVVTPPPNRVSSSFPEQENVWRVKGPGERASKYILGNKRGASRQNPIIIQKYASSPRFKEIRGALCGERNGDVVTK